MILKPRLPKVRIKTNSFHLSIDLRERYFSRKRIIPFFIVAPCISMSKTTWTKKVLCRNGSHRLFKNPLFLGRGNDMVEWSQAPIFMRNVGAGLGLNSQIVILPFISSIKLIVTNFFLLSSLVISRMPFVYPRSKDCPRCTRTRKARWPGQISRPSLSRPI